jgi:uncharacterized RDD family membrane protein YckC
MKTAPILARFAALLIDAALVLLFSAAAFAAALTGYRLGAGSLTFINLSCILLLSSVLSCLIYLFYFTHLTMREGMTVGKRIMSVRVVRRDGAQGVREPGFARSLVRAVAYVLSAMICFIGFFMALFFRGKTLHDMIAGTEVIRDEGADACRSDLSEEGSREEI